LGIVSGNQALGFFLTPQSPSMIFSLNSVRERGVMNIDVTNLKKIPIKHKFVQEFEIKQAASYESIEEYELGFNNIAQIRILDANGKNVVSENLEIVFNINYRGLKDFATMLLVLANNYESNQEYPVAHSKFIETQYNMGILLTEKSSKLVIKMDNLGCVYNYDICFGNH